MVEIGVVYEGELHCRAVHGPSETTLETDAPVDNHGRGESFSPTDLVATALGTCMATVMGIRARSQSYGLAGLRVRVEKHMTTTRPRRIARLTVRITVPPAVSSAIDDAEREVLRTTAETCPVRLSLLDAIDVPIEVEWE
jgi:putative redox protein